MQDYNNTDQRLHQLCQIIAKVNRAYVPEKEDDSHTNLYYDSSAERILGRWIDKSPGGRIILSFDLSDLNFVWLNEDLSSLHKIITEGKVYKSLENEIAGYLNSLGLDEKLFLRELHYKIPEYPFKNEPFRRSSYSGIEEWKYFRKLANEACEELLEYTQTEAETRIWPHHFDTGIYTEAKPGMGIGFGLAMEDSMVGQPYFYLSGYSSGREIEYFELPRLTKGRWLVYNQWKGAILPLDQIPYRNPIEALQIIFRFVKESIGWYLETDQE